MPVALKATGLGKSYVIRHRMKRAMGKATLREEISATVGEFLRGKGRIDGSPRERETFWALQDVNFEIQEGEAVGFIGHNGAGKSTLLKLISRITEPTTGELIVRGRVASILEVATGFHPELTGRENIYLKGAIMGLKRVEIRRQFDSIVDFSEVEQFLDTPVKRYSSGMYVKLGFAVAAHLDPEILVVDEVLAVGDARFQKKCIDRMQEILRQEGRTILFVSHNLSLIQSLCSRVFTLRGGQIVDSGAAGQVVERYLGEMETVGELNLALRTDRTGRGQSRLERVEVFAPTSNGGRAPLSTGDPMRIELSVSRMLPNLSAYITLYDAAEHLISSFDSTLYGPGDTAEGAVEGKLICEIDALPLVPGRYRLNVNLRAEGELQDQIGNVAIFEVLRSTFKGRQLVPWGGVGAVCFEHRWITPEHSGEVRTGASA